MLPGNANENENKKFRLKRQKGYKQELDDKQDWHDDKRNKLFS